MTQQQQVPSLGTEHFSQISFFKVCTAFGIYVLIQLLIVPLCVIAWLLLQHRTVGNLTSIETTWINGISILVSCLAVLLYAGITSEFLRTPRRLKPFFWGVCSWSVGYPVVALVSYGVTQIVDMFYHGPSIEQLAVGHLKSTMGHPLLFQLTIVEVTLLVPIVEELLFRGYLMNWMKRWVGVIPAILSSSLVFALFHYSSNQGIFNIELIAALFVLACFLGFLYEKFQSVYAPIGLHVAFNSISVAMIIMGGSQK